MSRQARQQSNTGVYHVIQRGVNRMLIFHEDADRLVNFSKCIVFV